jgi:hypothetical protein
MEYIRRKTKRRMRSRLIEIIVSSFAAIGNNRRGNVGLCDEDSQLLGLCNVN